MNPQTIDLDHGRPLFDPLEKHAFRLLNSLQRRVRPEAQPLAERFGDDNSPRFIDPDVPTLSDTMCYWIWQIFGFWLTPGPVRMRSRRPKMLRERFRIEGIAVSATGDSHE
jgi:hypothetical protein